MNVNGKSSFPRWYSLTIAPRTGYPCIVLNRAIIDIGQRLDPSVISHTRDEHGLDSSAFPFYESPSPFFGFGKHLEKISEDGVWVTYLMRLPKIFQKTERVCADCRGEKLDRFRDPCIYCEGTGKEHEIRWSKAKALCCSINLLLHLLKHSSQSMAVCDYDSGCDSGRKQLISLSTVAKQGLHGYSLFGNFFPDLVDFLKNFGADCRFLQVQMAMQKVHEKMWCKNRFDRMGIKARQDLPGNLSLIVPGNACEVRPCPRMQLMRMGEGLEFTSHNVDSPLQQLTLITGLAAVCDMFDRYGGLAELSQEVI